MLITKNFLVTRDLHLLTELASHETVKVAISVTTLDPALQRAMEPRTSSPERRLEAAVERGAKEASCVPLRLPYGVKDLFLDWLDRHFPDRKDKIVNRILEMRGGRLNDPRLVSRMKGQGPMAKQVMQLFHVARRRAGLDGPGRLKQMTLGI